jgi:ribosomal protein L6P/L9E
MNKKIYLYKVNYKQNDYSFFFKLINKIICFIDLKHKIITENKSVKILNDKILYISNNNIKNFNNNKRDLLTCFFRDFYFFIKGNNQGFFFKYRIVGLGFKLRRLFILKNNRFLRLDLGFSHSIFYKIPYQIGVYAKKKKFFFFSENFNLLYSLSQRVRNFRKVNPYKEKGILFFNYKLKLKSGKQQQR